MSRISHSMSEERRYHTWMPSILKNICQQSYVNNVFKANINNEMRSNQNHVCQYVCD